MKRSNLRKILRKSQPNVWYFVKKIEAHANKWVSHKKKTCIKFSCRDAFLQRAELCSFKFILLLILIPNSLTDFDVLIVMFLIFNVIIVLLLLFPICKIIAWNLLGFAIIIFLWTILQLILIHLIRFLKDHCYYSSLQKQCYHLQSCKVMISLKQLLSNEFKNIGPNIKPWGSPDNKVWKELKIWM